jgi:hypothetical protein
VLSRRPKLRSRRLRRSRKQYPAILRRDIRLPKTPDRAAFEGAIAEAWSELLSHYEIDVAGEGAWCDLAWALIYDHVPAFRSFGGFKAGRQPTREDQREARNTLRAEVDQLKTTVHTDRSALRILEKRWTRYPQKNPFPKPRSLKTLQKDLKVARAESSLWSQLAVLLMSDTPRSGRRASP